MDIFQIFGSTQSGIGQREKKTVAVQSKSILSAVLFVRVRNLPPAYPLFTTQRTSSWDAFYFPLHIGMLSQSHTSWIKIQLP